MLTDLLIISVLQLYRVVSHTQQRDDEVDQSKDAVEPQKVVPVRHKNIVVTWMNIASPVFSFTVLCYFMRFDVIHKVLDLLCANIGQCCSSKVFRTVSCINNET